VDQLAIPPANPDQAVLEEQVEERHTPQRDLQALDLGEIAEVDLS
jgi:hypothetical protein